MKGKEEEWTNKREESRKDRYMNEKKGRKLDE